MTLRRLDPVAAALVEELRTHLPVEVRTVQARPTDRRQGSAAPTKRRLLAVELLFLLRHLTSPRHCRSHWRFLARDGHYATLLFARILNLFGQPRRVYLLNFYIHDLGRSPLVKATLRFLLTPNVRVLAQTRSEQRYFREFLPQDNVTHIPYSQGESRYVAVGEAMLGDYVFAGGMVNRDYDTLLRCVASLPSIPFVVVASVMNKMSEPIPANVTVLKDRPAEEFDRLLAESRLVVIPLREDVGSSGQMVLLMAMSFGKAVVMPRAGALVDYVEPGRTGVLYELGDESSLRSSIAELHDDRSKLVAIGGAAREAYAAHFTPAHYQRRVVAYVCDDNGPAD